VFQVTGRSFFLHEPASPTMRTWPFLFTHALIASSRVRVAAAVASAAGTTRASAAAADSHSRFLLIGSPSVEVGGRLPMERPRA
jgi:hypothetical protein